MPAPGLKIRFHEKPIKRPVFITDIDSLNYLVTVAKAVVAQPTKSTWHGLSRRLGKPKGRPTMNHKSDFWELFFSVVIPAIVIVIIAAVIMGAPSIDAVVWGR